MAKDEFGGYAARFEKAGKTVRELTTFSACPECGMPMEVTRTWRNQPGKDKGSAYRIQGMCPKGHAIERYGHGEAVA